MRKEVNGLCFGVDRWWSGHTRRAIDFGKAERRRVCTLTHTSVRDGLMRLGPSPRPSLLLYDFADGCAMTRGVGVRVAGHQQVFRHYSPIDGSDTSASLFLIVRKKSFLI
ncbi:unnamed protein product [Caenorhabditis auriculariae]|uniref:Uncharacterized protein n=1 Tax=Caenorhabditis auriculariae TaxID=2777116 RepID=A0A8S1HHS3_9PELO|nr:unnamed protein product [Caenorhabditis auriculariae]